jgi:hypothetical protein
MTHRLRRGGEGQRGLDRDRRLRGLDPDLGIDLRGCRAQRPSHGEACRAVVGAERQAQVERRRTGARAAAPRHQRQRLLAPAADALELDRTTGAAPQLELEALDRLAATRRLEPAIEHQEALDAVTLYKRCAETADEPAGLATEAQHRPHHAHADDHWPPAEERRRPELEVEAVGRDEAVAERRIAEPDPAHGQARPRQQLQLGIAVNAQRCAGHPLDLDDDAVAHRCGIDQPRQHGHGRRERRDQEGEADQDRAQGSTDAR